MPAHARARLAQCRKEELELQKPTMPRTKKTKMDEGAGPSPPRQLIPPAREVEIVLLRYDSNKNPHCAATAAQNAVQNPQLTSGATLEEYHALGSTEGEGEGDGKNYVDLSTIFLCWVNMGIIAGTPGEEFTAAKITHFERTIEAGDPTYEMFDGEPGSDRKFLEYITGAHANEFGIMSVQLVDNASDEVENHFLALWRRADNWYISGGEDGGKVFRIAHGNSGEGIKNLLFSEEGRQALCNGVGRVFHNKRCKFSVKMNGTGDNYVSPIVFLPKIQLKAPKNWDDVINKDIAYEVPWPVTRTARHKGGKMHSVQIIRDTGDNQFIEDLAPGEPA